MWNPTNPLGTLHDSPHCLHLIQMQPWHCQQGGCLPKISSKHVWTLYVQTALQSILWVANSYVTVLWAGPHPQVSEVNHWYFTNSTPFFKASWVPAIVRKDLLWGSMFTDTTLQGIDISHLGKRNIIFKMPFLRDMLVPWRVNVHRYYAMYALNMHRHCATVCRF